MNFFRHLIILTLAMLACGTLSMSFGKELGWDLVNYHYYQPYAILHGRTHLDFWPSSFIFQYINPVMDFVCYFLITYFSPAAAEFILGALHGINFWLLFVIANIFLRTSIALDIAFLGMYAPSVLSGIGSFQNDNFDSIFVLGSVLFFIKGLQSFPNKKNFCYAGLLIGIATGLKLTAAVFSLGLILAIFLLPISMVNRMRTLLLTGISLTVGLLLVSGYWMYLMWVQHHNPLFPFFFNTIFHSSDFSTMNWRDTRFLPHGIWQTIFFPFYFSWDGRTADGGGFRDFRFAMVYVLFIFLCIFRFFSRRPYQKALEFNWLLAFFIFSYVAWQYYFSIARYLSPLEMLAPLLIYLLVLQIPVRPYLHTSLLILLFYALFYFMTPIPLSRARWYSSTFFNVKLPNTVTRTNEAMVLVAYVVFTQFRPGSDGHPRPQTYLIPYFPPRWRFVGVPFAHQKYFDDINATQKIRGLIQTYSHPIYLLTADSDMPELYRTAFSFGLVPAGKCDKIFSDRQKILRQTVLLCPVKRQ